MEGWIIGGMSPTGKNSSTWRKACPTGTLSKTNSTLTGLALSPGQPVEWYWQGKIEAVGARQTPVPHCLLQKPHELAWDWPQAFTVRHQQLTAYSYRRIQKWSCQCTMVTKCHRTTCTRQQRHNGSPTTAFHYSVQQTRSHCHHSVVQLSSWVLPHWHPWCWSCAVVYWESDRIGFHLKWGLSLANQTYSVNCDI